MQIVLETIQRPGEFAQSREIRSRETEEGENVSNVPEMR